MNMQSCEADRPFRAEALLVTRRANPGRYNIFSCPALGTLDSHSGGIEYPDISVSVKILDLKRAGGDIERRLAMFNKLPIRQFTLRLPSPTDNFCCEQRSATSRADRDEEICGRTVMRNSPDIRGGPYPRSSWSEEHRMNSLYFRRFVLLLHWGLLSLHRELPLNRRVLFIHII
jgi:hypothetical protein